jgi:hypothetical protein
MNVVKKAAVLAVLSAVTLEVAALSITPSSSLYVTSGNQTGVPKILEQIAKEGYVLGTSQYKKDYDNGAESGDLKNSYSTSFNSSVSGGSVTWDGPGIITGAQYFLVKDGNHSPAWYLFDISGWDGKESIEFSNFWLGPGAISHVAIFGGTTSVPDGGATAILLGVGVLGLAALRRKS